MTPTTENDTASEHLVDEDAVPLVGHGTRSETATDLPSVTETVVEVVQVEQQAAAQHVQQSSVAAWLFRADREAVRVDIDQLPDIIADDANFVWLDLSEYGESELRDIAQILHVHEGAVHATLSPWQRPSLITYTDHFLVTSTVARPDPQTYRVHAGEMDVVAGNNFLISAHKLRLPFYNRALARARQSRELSRLDSAFMLYILLDELLAYYDELNRHLQGEIERMEEGALHDSSDEFLERLLRFRRYAFALYQLADQHREVFTAFLRPDFQWGACDDTERYFRDLDARLSYLLSVLVGNREAVNGAFEIYVSHVTHRTNQIIKVLTMVSTVLLPATLIIYLFGANLANSFGTPAFASPGGFSVMILAIVLVSGSIALAFRRQGWL